MIIDYGWSFCLSKYTIICYTIICYTKELSDIILADLSAKLKRIFALFMFDDRLTQISYGFLIG